jgi:hypothetical protein
MCGYTRQAAWKAQKGRKRQITESREMARRGNPSPDTSGLRPFKPGQSGNPGGKTKEQVALSRENAERAMRIRQRILNAAEAKLNELSTDEVLESYVDAAMLKLLKDSEDRGLGAPVQPTDNQHSFKGLDVVVRK